MFAETIRHAVMASSRADLSKVAQHLWKGHAAGAIEDSQAQELAELIEARKVLPIERPAPRRVGSRPKSAASLERRRRWVSAGMMPPSIACQFTMGECAVLAVLAAEVVKCGDSRLPIAAIAALAGVGETTVRNALREAKRLGVLLVQERRIAWNRNGTNVVQIVSPEWMTWLRLAKAGRGGCKSAPGTSTTSKPKPFAPFEERGNRQSGPLRGVRAPRRPERQEANERASAARHGRC